MNIKRFEFKLVSRSVDSLQRDKATTSFFFNIALSEQTKKVGPRNRELGRAYASRLCVAIWTEAEQSDSACLVISRMHLRALPMQAVRSFVNDRSATGRSAQRAILTLYSKPCIRYDIARYLLLHPPHRRIPLAVTRTDTPVWNNSAF